tara:strand:+ start:151 stop:282 length:132 start_codon:yes stop_codon:yes gene_type:complete
MMGEETKLVITSLAEIKVLWLIFGGVLGFIVCEIIKHRNKWDR